MMYYLILAALGILTYFYYDLVIHIYPENTLYVITSA